MILNIIRKFPLLILNDLATDAGRTSQKAQDVGLRRPGRKASCGVPGTAVGLRPVTRFPANPEALPARLRFPGLGRAPIPPKRFLGDSGSLRWRRPCSLWAIRGFHPDLRENNGHSCPVLRFLWVDDLGYLGFQRPPGSYQKYEQWFQISGLKQERRATKRPAST